MPPEVAIAFSAQVPPQPFPGHAYQRDRRSRVRPVSTAEYGCSNWKWWLSNVTISAGLQNVTDEDPPFVADNFENGYDEALTTIKGRFWYVQLKKRF
jgi:outer membrane receptor protein involved in Fe transport